MGDDDVVTQSGKAIIKISIWLQYVITCLQQNAAHTYLHKYNANGIFRRQHPVPSATK